MRKKLLAGVMALALCSTNMPPQTIFAEEFTSGNLEEVTEETPEIFTDEEQDTAKEASEDISAFSRKMFLHSATKQKMSWQLHKVREMVKLICLTLPMLITMESIQLKLQEHTDLPVMNREPQTEL